MTDASTKTSRASLSIDRQGAGFDFVTPVETVITATNTPVKAAGITAQAGDALGASLDGNNRITWRSKRRQLCLVSIGLSIGNVPGTSTITASIFKNGAPVPGAIFEVLSENSNDYGAFSCPVVLEYGDYLEIWIGNTSNSNNITVNDGSMTIFG